MAQLLAPCLVTLFGGMVFYALLVELSFVLTGVGVTSTATIGGISAIMSLATASERRPSHGCPAIHPARCYRSSSACPPSAWSLVFSSTALPVITLGAVFTGFGTGLLLPTLLTWAVNRLRFEQRGRGTGLWTGTLFIGQFLSPILLAAIGAGVGGLQPALGVLGVVTAVAALATRCWSVATTNGSTSHATKTKIEQNHVPQS